MDMQLLLAEMMKREIERLTDIRLKMEQQLKQLPYGSITLKRGRLYHSYREACTGKQHMVLIKDPKLLNGLKVRRQIMDSLPLLEKRIQNCNNYIANDVIYDPGKMTLELPEHYRGGKSPHLWLPGDVDPEEWANADYVSNPAEIRTPNKTVGGRIVRSKSEAIIGSLVEQYDLLYRYEQEIIIFGEIFYPDFIFLLPECRRLVYYEHFGKMDDPDYAMKAMHKLEVYPQYGLYLGFNFFVSYETKDRPFSFDGAQNILKRILELDHKAS